MTTSIQIVLRKDKINKKGEAALYMRFIKNRRSTNIYTGIRIADKYWDERRKMVKSSHPNSERLNNNLKKLEIEYRDRVLNAEGNDLSISIKDIKGSITGRNSPDFFEIGQGIVDYYLATNRIGSHAKAMSILKKVSVYAKTTKLFLHEMDYQFIKKYDRYLKEVLKNKINTAHKDMRFIRQIFHVAVKEGLIEVKDNPFTKFKLHLEKTSRVFMTLDEVEKMAAFPLVNAKEALCRDMFVFACYTGLRVSDVLLLQHRNIVGNRLLFTIRKTSTQVGIHLPSPALRVLETYHIDGQQDGGFVFPLLRGNLQLSNPIELDKAVSNATAKVNRHLKTIAASIGLLKHVSFHVSRHSFATNALRLGIRLEHVQKLLGHANIKETQLYAKIVDEDLDEAMKSFDK